MVYIDPHVFVMTLDHNIFIFQAIHDAKMRRHLRTTELTIQQIKQCKTCERIFRRDVQILERFAETLRSLNGFTQELPLLLDALLELCNISIQNDIVQTVLTAVLVLFGVEIKPEWVCNYKNKCALVYIAEGHMSDPPSVQIEILESLLNNNGVEN